MNSSSKAEPALQTYEALLDEEAPAICEEKPAHISAQASCSSNQESRQVLHAGISYVLTSAFLVLFNKHALSSFSFGCAHALLFFHCLLAVVLVKGAEMLSLIQPLQPIKWSIVKVWMPVNLIFVGMIVTSFLALQLVGIGMFTILKNLTNVITIGGDQLFFGKSYGIAVWTCIVLMAFSAIAGGVTDVHFSAAGYTWQIINCFFTAGYSLYLSHAMGQAAQHTNDKQRMSELSMVYYNNLLSLPPIACLLVWRGELAALPLQAALYNPEFLVVAVFGGLLGTAISFTSLSYMSRSSPTVYSLTGSMGKVIVAVAGMLLFHEASSLGNLASMAVGLVASIVFVSAKAYVVK